MQNDRPLNFRALLAPTRTPFAVADYDQGAVIFLEGAPGDSVMHIERGCVRLAVTTPGGKEAVVGLLEPGAFLGADALGEHATRRQTATAMTATEVLVVRKAAMVELLRTQPVMADRFIAYILARTSRLEADLTDQLLHSSEQRLARTLLALAGYGERPLCRCVLPHVSQEIVAEMVGTTRSRVCVLMGKFRKLGLIEDHGRAIRVNPSLLRVVRDETNLKSSRHLASPDGARSKAAL